MSLARSTPISKIKVKDLCEACRLDRTTFYSHFMDKYDLVCWIYEQYYLQEANTTASLNNEEMIGRINTRIYNVRWFFTNALQDTAQNNLRQYILDFYYREHEKVLCEYLLSAELNEEIKYDLQSYLYACMGHITDWLTGKLAFSPEKLAYYQYRDMPDILKNAWKAVSEKRDMSS